MQESGSCLSDSFAGNQIMFPISIDQYIFKHWPMPIYAIKSYWPIATIYYFGKQPFKTVHKLLLTVSNESNYSWLLHFSRVMGYIWYLIWCELNMHLSKCVSQRKPTHLSFFKLTLLVDYSADILNETCHAKTGLKTFDVAIQRAFLWLAAAHPSLLLVWNRL